MVTDVSLHLDTTIAPHFVFINVFLAQGNIIISTVSSASLPPIY